LFEQFIVLALKRVLTYRELDRGATIRPTEPSGLRLFSHHERCPCQAIRREHVVTLPTRATAVRNSHKTAARVAGEPVNHAVEHPGVVSAQTCRQGDQHFRIDHDLRLSTRWHSSCKVPPLIHDKVKHGFSEVSAESAERFLHTRAPRRL
jgi:hypothetical protein